MALSNRSREAARISKLSTDSEESRLVLIVAGEASADLHGSNLVKAMRALYPRLNFFGVGGERMAEAGVRILTSSSDMAVVGLTEVFRRLPVIFRTSKKLKFALKHDRPDLLILIDYPDFNIHIAKTAKLNRVPVLYYISPQVWAWRKGRVKKIAHRVDRMAVILPFEKSFYNRRGISVDYVGHPLMDTYSSKMERAGSADRFSGHNFPTVGLLPGSRRDEVANLLPLMVKALEIIGSRYPGLRCMLPLASTIDLEFVHSFLADSKIKIEIVEGDTRAALGSCDAAMVTSGTATLETAIMGVPMVLVYKVSPVTYQLGKFAVTVPYIGLVNLVAGEKVVQELIQGEVTPERMAREIFLLLENTEARENMKYKLEGVRERLGRGGASSQTAKIAIEMMKI